MSGYYDLVRREIAPLLPQSATRIVDVGCGEGRTARWLKERYPSAHVIGIEGNREIEPALAANVDESFIHDLNLEPPDIGAPDLVLFLDVLEHLVDPLQVLKNFVGRMAGDGVVIVSLPNVSHPSVALPLALRGRWDYTDAGILDRTHLRFFVYDTAIGLIEAAGLYVDAGLYSGLQGPKSQLLDRITLRRIRHRIAKQFIMRGGRRRAEATVWGVAEAAVDVV